MREIIKRLIRFFKLLNPYRRGMEKAYRDALEIAQEYFCSTSEGMVKFRASHGSKYTEEQVITEIYNKWADCEFDHLWYEGDITIIG